MLNSLLFLVILVSFSSLISANLLELNEKTLQEHNNYRNLHGTHVLQLDENLIELAKKDAESYALTGVSNSVVYKGVTLGKNIGIFKGYRTSPTGSSITSLWYETGKNFNYNVNDFQNAGSFTQVVWQGSYYFGLGEYQIGSNVYVVGLYYPPGNIIGRVHENVHPLVRKRFWR